jgi:DNA-binding MltR family transcriptional regulator
MMRQTIPAPPAIATGPPDLFELIRSMHLHDESDRGFALTAAAWIDDAIEEVIRSRFVENKKAADELLTGDAPLATLSARIKLLYCMGIITEEVRKDLNIIRAIRNLFAHERGRVTFDTREIKDRCRSFSLSPEIEGITLMDKERPRTIFNAVAMHLIQYFMRLAEQPKRPKCDNGIKAYFKNLRARQRKRLRQARAEQEGLEE